MVKRVPVLVLLACMAGCAAKQPPQSRPCPTCARDGAHYAPPGFVRCPDGQTLTVVHDGSLCETGWMCVSGGRITCVAPDGAFVGVRLLSLVPITRSKP